MPEHIWSTIADPAKYANTNPVGTGPFMLSAFAPTQYTLKKNPQYWDAAKIAPSSVVFPAQASQPEHQPAGSQQRPVRLVLHLPAGREERRTSTATRPQLYWFPPGGTIGLFLNLTKAPYNNVSFRQGISQALDRTTISQKAVNGYMAQASLSGLILPNLQQWLNPSLPDQGLVSQNRTAAMADFAKAGYTLKGGKLTGPGGTQATMSIVLPNSFTDWAAAATEISSELGQVGIKVNLDEPQYAQYSQTIQAGTFNAAIGGFGGTGSPYTDFNHALNAASPPRCNTPTVNNFERFKNPQVNQALATLAAATGKSAQQQATDRLEQMMYSHGADRAAVLRRQLGPVLHQALHRLAVGQRPLHPADQLQQLAAHGGDPPGQR